MATQTTLAVPKSAPAAPGLTRMPLAIFSVPGVGQVDVMGYLPGSSDPVLLWDRKFAFAMEDIAKVCERGCAAAYLSRADALQVASQLRDEWASIVRGGSYSPCERFALLQIASVPDLDASFRRMNCARYLELAQQAGRDMAKVLSTGNVTARQLFDANQRGPSPGLRATNLAGYATVLARLLGVSELHELQEIAVGAMVHDIGARLLPPDYLNNIARLTARDRGAVENHARQGYEELRVHQGFNHGQLMMAYQHHEWVDGSGYPVAILGDEIHPWAKLLAIVDAFDAITSGQRKMLDLDQAILQLGLVAGTQLDSEITACWSSSLRLA